MDGVYLQELPSGIGIKNFRSPTAVGPLSQFGSVGLLLLFAFHAAHIRSMLEWCK